MYSLSANEVKTLYIVLPAFSPRLSIRSVLEPVGNLQCRSERCVPPAIVHDGDTLRARSVDGVIGAATCAGIVGCIRCRQRPSSHRTTIRRTKSRNRAT